MTNQEFEERVGWKVTSEEFNAINELYMVTDMDKDTFCKEYREMHSGSIEMNKVLLEIGKKLGDIMATNEKIIKDAQKRNEELADMMIRKADEYDVDDLYTEAKKLIGEKQVIIKKLEYEYELSEDEVSYIKNNLQ